MIEITFTDGGTWFTSNAETIEDAIELCIDTLSVERSEIKSVEKFQN